jgi:Serine/Threonine/Tyrosine Kinase found in polyvalent proteins
MISNDTKQTLKNIISGTIIEGKNDTLTATRNQLCSSFTTDTTTKRDFDKQCEIKKEQEKQLNDYISKNNLWITDFSDQENYLTEGGEAKIYFGKDNKSVIKLNDAVYYFTWLDFFNSILIHNLLFEGTKYELLGFKRSNETLFTVLKQAFIISDNPVNLADVKDLLEFNGFKNTRRNDYYNEELGLILEDIHDENVIVNSNVLFFIDTVFFINLKQP